jgi:hypothetical protein
MSDSLNAVVRCCKTCALWKIEQAQDAAGRVRKNRVALCQWKMSEPLPKSLHIWEHGPNPHFMSPDSGTDCPCWKQRKPNISIREIEADGSRPPTRTARQGGRR